MIERILGDAFISAVSFFVLFYFIATVFFCLHVCIYGKVQQVKALYGQTSIRLAVKYLVSSIIYITYKISRYCYMYNLSNC